MRHFRIYFIVLISLWLCSSVSLAHMSPVVMDQDTDNDGMPDSWEIANGLDISDPVDAFCDNDADQVINLFEFQLDCDPNDDSLPRKFQIYPNVTTEQLRTILDDNLDEAIFIQMSEGDYEAIVDPEFGNDNIQLEDRVRVMFQGGWNNDFTDYDPFLRRTKIIRNGTSIFFLFKFIFGIPSQEASSIIFDGLEFDQSMIYLTNQKEKSFLSLYNCSIYGAARNPILSLNGDNFLGGYEVNLVNTSIVNNDFTAILANNPDAIARIRLINSTISNNQENQSLVSDILINGTLDIDVTNSILWDEGDHRSIFVRDRSANNIGFMQDKIVNINARYSNMSPIVKGEYTGLDNLSATVIDIDPQFSNETTPHYTLDPSSQLIEAGEDVGMGYEGDSPDIGVNTFAYSSLRLIESIDTITPNCDLSDGVISLVMKQTNKDLEFSLSKNGSYTNDASFSGLSAGEHIVYIRTVDNCAHFQQKVVLDRKCLIACNLSLEDSDNDGMPNAWEIANGLDECDPIDAFCDNDGDQVWNIHEFLLQTDPKLFGSPVVFNAPIGTTSEELTGIILNNAGTAPIVIRLQEGVYNDLALGRSFVPNDGSDYRFMIQGGWDESFCDYDPFLRRTILNRVNGTSQFIGLTTTGSNSASVSAILDGMEFIDLRISFSSGFKETSTSISNSSITHPNITEWNGAGSYFSPKSDMRFHLINSSIVDTRPILIGASDSSVMKAQIVNSTLSDFRKVGQFEAAAISSQIDAKAELNMKIENSILWDEAAGASSIRNDIVSQDNIGDNFLGLNIRHSYLSPYNLDDGGGRLIIDSQEDGNVFFEDPQFGMQSPPYYRLSPTSPAVSSGIVNGLPYDDSAPDIGVNLYAYSSIRLIEAIDTITPDCNLSDGSISLTLMPTNKDLEFSLTNLDVDFQSSSNFNGLPAGEYIVYIRTADNCAHFQQKVTLDNKCLTVCNLSLEDSDNDGIPNEWEIANGLDECDPTDAFCDYDGDHVINLFEYQLDTDINNDSSPRIVQVTSNSSELEIISYINNSGTDPVVIRMAEGDYDLSLRFVDYIVGSINSPERFRFLMQGGWDTGFCDRDPFQYITRLADPDNKYGQVFGVGNHTFMSDNILLGREAYIFEGISFAGTIGIGRRDPTLHLISILNCSFDVETGDNFNPLDIWTGNQTTMDIRIMNSTFRNSSATTLINNTAGELDVAFMNCTITDPVASSVVSIPWGIDVSANNNSQANLYIKDCIAWDERPFYSISENEFLNNPNSTINISAVNSVLDDFSNVDKPLIANWNLELNDITNEDPIFGPLILGHMPLADSSPYKESGTNISIPFNGDAPDIGVNTFAYSAIRLVERVDTIRPSCGQSDGSISLLMIETNKELEFSLTNTNDFQSVPNFSGLSEGEYLVYIRTKDNCAHFQQKVSLRETDVNLDVEIVKTDATCGEDNGLIELVVPQDWIGYQYALVDTTMFQSETIFDNLSANIYPVWIKTPAGCNKFLDAVILNSEDEIDLDTSSVNSTTCGRDDGSVTLQVSDAIGPVEIYFNNNLPSNLLDYTDLSEGLYSVLAIDSLGCRDSIEVTIPSSTSIAIIDTLITQPSCGQDNGSIALQVNDPGSVSEILINDQPSTLLLNQELAPDNYTLIAMDNSGCSDTLEIDLFVSVPVEIIALDTIGTSCGQDNGSLTITDVNGNPTSFSTDGIEYSSDIEFTDLPDGDFFLYAQNDDCADTTSFTISASTSIEVQVANFNDTSCGEMNGSVQLETINGTGPYTYSIDSTSNQSGYFDTLPSGEYIVFVEDVSGCIDDEIISIGESTGVALEAEVTDGVCEELGIVRLLASGGSGSYEYSDSTQAYSTISVLEGLVSGEYTFYLRDSDGCIDTVNRNVTVYDRPELTAEFTPAYCEEPVGMVTLTGEKGKGILRYALQGEALNDSFIYSELSAGDYTFIVSDEADCTSTIEVTIESTPKVTIDNLSAEQLFCGDFLSGIEFTPDGTGELIIELTDVSGNIVDDTNGLPEGQYRLKVSDELGCEKVEFIVVRKEECQLYIPSVFNPTESGVNQNFSIGAPEESNFFIESFRVFDRWGSLIYNASEFDPLTFKDWWDGSYNGKLVEHGVYVYQLQLGGEKSETLSGTITLIR